ncbi:hypothetical protein HK099_000703, partial [Clydaea vesicula]
KSKLNLLGKFIVAANLINLYERNLGQPDKYGFNAFDFNRLILEVSSLIFYFTLAIITTESSKKTIYELNEKINKYLEKKNDYEAEDNKKINHYLGSGDEQEEGYLSTPFSDILIYIWRMLHLPLHAMLTVTLVAIQIFLEKLYIVSRFNSTGLGTLIPPSTNIPFWPAVSVNLRVQNENATVLEDNVFLQSNSQKSMENSSHILLNLVKNSYTSLLTQTNPIAGRSSSFGEHISLINLLIFSLSLTIFFSLVILIFNFYFEFKLNFHNAINASLYQLKDLKFKLITNLILKVTFRILSIVMINLILTFNVKFNLQLTDLQIYYTLFCCIVLNQLILENLNLFYFYFKSMYLNRSFNSKKNQKNKDIGERCSPEDVTNSTVNDYRNNNEILNTREIFDDVGYLS